jgi:hypothetical protein
MSLFKQGLGPIYGRPWSQLSIPQRNRATLLGFDEQRWNHLDEAIWRTLPGFDDLSLEQYDAVFALQFTNPNPSPNYVPDAASMWNPFKRPTPLGKAHLELIGHDEQTVSKLLGPSQVNQCVFSSPDDGDEVLKAIQREVHDPGGSGYLGAWSPKKGLDEDRRRVMRRLGAGQWHPIPDIVQGLIEDDSAPGAAARRCKFFAKTFHPSLDFPTLRRYVYHRFRSMLEKHDLHCEFGAVQSRSAARCTREGCTQGDTCVDASHYRAANATVFTLEADSNGTPPQLPQLPAGVIGVCKVQLVRNGARRHISVSWLQEDDDDSTGGENDDDCRLHYMR